MAPEEYKDLDLPNSQLERMDEVQLLWFHNQK